MFTGLVRCMGKVASTAPAGGGLRLCIDISGLGGNVGPGQSIAVNGVCLTVTALSGGQAFFDAVAETASRSTLGGLKKGDAVNLEPALKASDALDGHIVQGHVDDVGVVLEIEADESHNRRLTVSLPASIRRLVAEKGSIAIDGISLTVATAGYDSFTVAIIPVTWLATTLAGLKPGSRVNLEADVLARYAARILTLPPDKAEGALTEDFLRRHGFA